MQHALATRIVNHDELRRAAQKRLPRFAFDFLDGGAGSDGGVAHNRAVLESFRLVPRYGVTVAEVDTTVEFLGQRWQRPYGIAPMGLANLIWPGADLALARLAAARGFPYVASTPASTALEDLAAACPGHLWFQMYVARDAGITADLAARARSAQVATMLVTLDTPLPARRERNLRNRLTLPLRLSARNWLEIARHPRWACATLAQGAPRFANLERYAPKGMSRAQIAEFVSETLTVACTWEELEALRRIWPGGLLAKGILDPADAARCEAIGCDGVVLSNHGGRQLESAVSPLEVVEEVAAVTRRQAGRHFAIVVDSGLRRGSDIVKSLALGADFLLLGRLGLYGMGAAGTAGVEHAFAMLDDELNNTLAQLGQPVVARLSKSILHGHPIRNQPPGDTRRPPESASSPTKV
jgi:(S)-mandelate dehydrogenase